MPTLWMGRPMPGVAARLGVHGGVTSQEGHAPFLEPRYRLGVQAGPSRGGRPQFLPPLVPAIPHHQGIAFLHADSLGFLGSLQVVDIDELASLEPRLVLYLG